jgi:hypothetical protein
MCSYIVRCILLKSITATALSCRTEMQVENEQNKAYCSGFLLHTTADSSRCSSSTIASSQRQYVLLCLAKPQNKAAFRLENSTSSGPIRWLLIRLRSVVHKDTRCRNVTLQTASVQNSTIVRDSLDQ